jgi:hypothetical protein
MGITLSGALAGMTQIGERLSRTADRIAKAGTGLKGEGDLTRDFVDLDVEKGSFAAKVKVAKSADEMVGTLLDIIA